MTESLDRASPPTRVAPGDPGRRLVGAAPAPTGPAHIIRDDEEALAIAGTLARRFAAGARERDRERTLPWEEVEAFSQSGLWGITVPRAHGGAEVSVDTLSRVVSIIAEADSSLGQIPQSHFYSLEVLRVGGTPSQQAFFHERVLRGERLGNALAEVGERDFARRTRLLREEAGWSVQGEKFYATGAVFAHWVPTLAVTPEGGQGDAHLVFIPRSAPGLSVTDDWDGFGQRSTGSGSVSLDQVAVDPQWVVAFSTSFDQPTAIGPFAQILHAAIDLGIGRGALAATLPFIREHARPWLDSGVERAADDPLLLQQLGNVQVRLRAAQALISRAARLVQAAQGRPTEASVAEASVAVAEARVLSSAASLLASNKLLELSGTGATLGVQGLDRHWRDARTHTLHDPVRWKVHAIGNHVLNGVAPPRHGAI